MIPTAVSKVEFCKLHAVTVEHSLSIVFFRRKVPKRFCNESVFEDSENEGSSEYEVDDELPPPPSPFSQSHSLGNQPFTTNELPFSQTYVSMQHVFSSMSPVTVISTPLMSFVSTPVRLHLHQRSKSWCDYFQTCQVAYHQNQIGIFVVSTFFDCII